MGISRVLPWQQVQRSAIAVGIMFVCFTGWLRVAASEPPRPPAKSVTLSHPTFDPHFLPRVLRVDLLHEGNRASERFQVEKVMEEPALSINRRRMIDTTNLGAYEVRVYDREGEEELRGPLLYSRGYSSLFGEWLATSEAKTVLRRLHESVRVPFPRKPIELAIFGRDEQNEFEEIFAVRVDPESDEISKRAKESLPRAISLHRGGDPGDCVDLLILADGYTKNESRDFIEFAEKLTKKLFSVHPFSGMENKFNVRAIPLASKESGVDRPSANSYRDTALDSSFDSLGVARYLMTQSNEKWRDAAGGTPYDIVCIVVNSKLYGGGGIYNLYCTVSAASDAEFVFVHEVGHLLAGLADEYVDTSSEFHEYYTPGREPWEPNVTWSSNRDQLKWIHHVEDSTPVPTPSYGSKYAGATGCFLGGGYRKSGIYRPARHCLMKDSVSSSFCDVCVEWIQKAVDYESN